MQLDEFQMLRISKICLVPNKTIIPEVEIDEMGESFDFCWNQALIKRKRYKKSEWGSILSSSGEDHYQACSMQNLGRTHLYVIVAQVKNLE